MKDRSFKYAKIVKLIDLYKENNCLWDISSPEFRRQEKRQSALSKIAKVFEITPAEVKKKIRSLRATYLLERRKVLASEKNVQDGLETFAYEPILAWYKYMSFLNNIIVFRTPPLADGTAKLREEFQFDATTKDTEEGEQSRLEKVEAIYYDNDGNIFKREEAAMSIEYLCEETVDAMDSIVDGVPDYFVDDDQQSSNKTEADDLQRDSEDLAALKADRIRVETEYFRKKAEYIDLCIEKEKKMQPLLIAKLKLEIENLTKTISETKN